MTYCGVRRTPNCIRRPNSIARIPSGLLLGQQYCPDKTCCTVFHVPAPYNILPSYGKKELSSPTGFRAATLSASYSGCTAVYYERIGTPLAHTFFAKREVFIAEDAEKADMAKERWGEGFVPAS